MAATRTVEIAVAWQWGDDSEGEWSTQLVTIPAQTPEEEVERAAVQQVLAQAADRPYDHHLIHAWLYADLGEDDDDEEMDHASA